MRRTIAIIVYPLATAALCALVYSQLNKPPRYARAISETPIFRCEYNKGPCFYDRNGYLQSTHWQYNAANNMPPAISKGWWVVLHGEPFERAGAKVILASPAMHDLPTEFDIATTFAVPYYSLELYDVPAENPPWRQMLPRWWLYALVWGVVQLLMVWKVRHG